MLDKATCRPASVAGRLTKYTARWTRGQNYVEQESQQRVRFDRSVDHAETVVVHDQSGGGLASVQALARLELAAPVRDLVTRSLASLGPDYVAIHVRNTDYQTDYLSFFQKLYPRVRNKILLVCSDDSRVVEAARRHFDQSDVRALMPVPDLGGRPIHRDLVGATKAEKSAVALASLVDLMALAAARKLYVAKATTTLSGYSRLAHYLHRDKALFSSLMGTGPRGLLARALSGVKARFLDRILLATVS